MKTKDLREKTDNELKDLIKERKQRLGQIKFDLAFKKLKDVNEPKKLRKDIARALTILKQR
jgi:large subunit ribosomal protein L29